MHLIGFGRVLLFGRFADAVDRAAFVGSEIAGPGGLGGNWRKPYGYLSDRNPWRLEPNRPNAGEAVSTRESEPPTLLSPGDKVRFIPISSSDFSVMRDSP